MLLLCASSRVVRPSLPAPDTGSGYSFHVLSIIGAISFPSLTTRHLKAESLVEGISSRGILGSKSGDESLGSLASGDGSSVGLANVPELVADAVGDDVGVQGVLLSLGDEGVDRQEGALIGLAARATELEADLGAAVAKVGGGVGIVVVASVVVIVIVVVVVVVVVLTGVDDSRRGGGSREQSKDERLGVHFEG